MICFSKYLRVVYYGCMVISLLHLQRIVVFAQIVSVRNTGVSFIDETNSTNFLYRSGCLRRHLSMPQFSLFGWQANLFVWRELCIWHQQNNQPLTVWLDTFQSFGYVPCNVSQIHGSVFRCCCRVRLAIVTFKAFIDSDSFVCHTMCAKKCCECIQLSPPLSCYYYYYSYNHIYFVGIVSTIKLDKEK